MKMITLSRLAVLGSLMVGPAVAQDADLAGSAKLAVNVEQCWKDWLKSEKLNEGKNSRPDGSFRFVAQGSGEVNADKTDTSRWLPARDAAFTIAELNARNSLAQFIGTTIRSDRSFDAFQSGGDEAPPVVKQAATQLSIADKALTLTGAALDNEIKKFKPEWDGTGRSEADRKQEITKIQTRVRENIASSARVFASGAFTAIQCEGPNVDGKYSVLTGLIWSIKLAQISESMINPAFTLPPAAPDLSVEDRFGKMDAANPEWMSVTSGARVWTDEKGQRIIVGFGSVPATSQASLDTTRAKTRAIAAIQRFVGEKVEGSDNDNIDFTYRETDSGNKSFNADSYNLKIDAKAKTLELQGVNAVKTWRGKHPWSGTSMTTVAVVWSRSSVDDAQFAKKALDSVGQNKTAPNSVSSSPVGAPVRGGATSKTSDF